MKRYKSIDIARGFAVFGMVFGHILNWWLVPEDYWLYLFFYYLLGPLAAGGFLFLSGMSGIFSYKKAIIMVNKSEDFSMAMVRNGFLLRALLLLVISFIYNIAIALAINNLTWIWAWFVLQTIGFSLLMSWPFLATSKKFRLVFGSIILIINFYLLELLTPYQGQANFAGVLYHVLFNPLDLYPIIPFFVIFLFGTVAGELLYEINTIEDQREREHAFKYKFIYPMFLLGIVLTTFAVLYQYPSFFSYYKFSAIVFGIGLICFVVSTIIWAEEFKIITTKKNYNFFQYYSYYSFTVFLGHNVLYFLFYQQLNAVTIWIPIIITLVLFTLLLKFMYEKLGPKASLKAGIGVLSLILAIKIEQKKYLKLGKVESALHLGKLLKFGGKSRS
jgi:uncharacterized membrane protein